MALAIVEISRNSDDRTGDGNAKRAFGVELEFAKNCRRNLNRRVHTIANLDSDDSFSRNDSIRHLSVRGTLQVVKTSSEKSLYRENRMLCIPDLVPLRLLADDGLSVHKGNDGRNQAFALGRANDDGLAMSAVVFGDVRDISNQAVGGPEIDTDDRSRILLVRRA